MTAPVTSEQRRRLELWLDEMERWNRRINLSTVPRDQAWARHVGDSLTLLDAARDVRSASVVDLGSGGGVPGVPLAVLRPDLVLHLVEADERKAGFLVHVCGLLSLQGVTVLARRAEDLGHEAAHRERHDLVVSRATAPAAVLCELALPLLRPGGVLLALVGDGPAAAAEAAGAAARCGGGTPEAPGPGLLRVAKEMPCPDELPRRPGVPQRRPLR